MSEFLIGGLFGIVIITISYIFFKVNFNKIYCYIFNKDNW